jgi:peptidoglycan hydrolase-like protein with peptidoglycan-binding domain
MKYPFTPLVLPSMLKGQINGRLDKNLLERVATGGKMLKPAADSFNAMYAEAQKQGITLKNIGDYRSYEGQLAMFMDRYSTKDEGRKPQVTRQYEGKTWFLKKGKAPSAAPDPTGKRGSNHGWGLAIDLAVEGKKGQILNIGSDKKAVKWLCENAPRFGFYLQGDNPKSPEFEIWHWQYCVGDAVPSALIGSAPAPVVVPIVATPIAPAPATAKKAAPRFTGDLRKGSKGTAVKQVQRKIGSTVDGDFGNATHKAVVAWQIQNGLKPDGVVGATTWAKMFG